MQWHSALCRHVCGQHYLEESVQYPRMSQFEMHHSLVVTTFSQFQPDPTFTCMIINFHTVVFLVYVQSIILVFSCRSSQRRTFRSKSTTSEVPLVKFCKATYNIVSRTKQHFFATAVTSHQSPYTIIYFDDLNLLDLLYYPAQGSKSFNHSIAISRN